METWQKAGLISNDEREEAMGRQLRPWMFGLCAALTAAMPAAGDEAPKRGGILTYVIPADAPPSFDAHRETTLATGRSGAPFFRVLMRRDQQKPGCTTEFVCELCTGVQQPTHRSKSC